MPPSQSNRDPAPSIYGALYWAARDAIDAGWSLDEIKEVIDEAVVGADEDESDA